MKMLGMAMIGVVLITAGSARVSGGQMLPASPGMSQPENMQRAELIRLRLAERQKKLSADADKLLVLSTALKQQVDESNKDILSVDMIRKAEEIEKLAHSVKERIKD